MPKILKGNYLRTAGSCGCGVMIHALEQSTKEPHLLIYPLPALTTVNNKWNDPIVMINDLEELKIISTKGYKLEQRVLTLLHLSQF